MSATELEAPTPSTVRISDLLIAGEQVPAKHGRYYETIEALTGEPIARVAAASVERQSAGTPTPDGRGIASTWSRVRFDIVLAPANV